MNAFLKYIEDGKIGEHIYGAVLDYCNKHRTLVLEHVSDYGFSYINEVNDIYPIFKTVWINEKGDTSIDFDIVLEVDMDCTGVCGKRHDHEDCSANMWILVSCTGDLKKKLEDFKIKSIEEYNDKTLMDSPLTGDFLPPMKKENYDDYARIILEKFYPEALTKPMEIDADLLAEKMGLKLVRTNITNDHSVFGQIFFDSADVEVFDGAGNCVSTHVDPFTVLIDDDTNFLYSYGSRNMTVVHECVHRFFHYRAFLFAQMLDEHLKNIRCQTLGGIDGGRSQTVVKIETQANALTPYIMMPKDTFKKYALDLIEDYGRIYGGDRLDHLPFIIEELADKFNVTKYAARKRLIEVGVFDAIGVLNWVDNNYVRPYRFKKDALKSNETFTVSINDLSSALVININLLNIINDVGFEFVENHLIIDDEKYIKKAKDGRPILTEYARYHLDECAVKFKVSYRNDYLSYGFGMVCYLCRDTTKQVEYDLSILANSNLVFTKEGEMRQRIHNKSINEILSNISGMQFGDAVSYLLGFLSMTEDELADDSDLSVKTISRYISQPDKKKEKRTVVAMIRGLNVPIRVAEKLLEKAGIILVPGNGEDDALRDVLLYLRTSSNSDVNDYVERRTGKPLTEYKY